MEHFKKFEIHSEDIEPFFTMLIGRYGMKLLTLAQQHGCSSREFGHTLAYWQYMKEGIKKISFASEEATHAHIAVGNEMRRFDKDMEKLKEKYPWVQYS